ncbi:MULTISPECIES: hypothetical protein [unclassified Alishewanella]|uniref:hypothetical protein n=1 Tax=unclassified Alishewanella TaxID=2628974 RepID=UPI0008236C53|nr:MULTISPECIES: hypothetical protein [unclassified Alishewanella]MCT8127482.1 hypothetical protein [Alishewanella sp. BS5-314]OCW96179.1 hypothetical protein A9165_13010 [Alishewanella sp. HH-ZS]
MLVQAVRWILGVVLALLIAAASWAATEPAQSSLQLVLGELPPYNCQDLATTPRCINNKIAAKLAHYSGLEISVSLAPYARALRILQQQQTDLMIVLQNQAVLAHADPLLALYDVDLVLRLHHSASRLAPQDIRLGVLRGLDQDVYRLLPAYRYVELSDYEQGVEMLALGRLDAILAPADALTFLLQRHGVASQMMAEPQLQVRQQVWLYCRKQACSAEQQRQLQLAVQQILPHMPAILQLMPITYYQ